MNYELRTTYVIIGALVALLLVRTCGNASPAPPPLPQAREVVFLHDTVYVQSPVTSRQPAVAVNRKRPVVTVTDTVYYPLPAVTVMDTVYYPLPTAMVMDTVIITDTAYCQPPTATDTVPAYQKWEARLYGGGGIGQLVAGASGCSMEEGDMAPNFGLELAYYFARQWGVSLGTDVSFYNVRLLMSGTASEDAGSMLTRHEETLRAAYLGIPLLMQFRVPVWGRHTFHAAAGGRLDLVVYDSYRATGIRRVAVAGSTIEPFGHSGKAALRTGASLVAETGLRWALSQRWGVYTGAYAGYGLFDVLPAASGVITQEPGTGSLLNQRNKQGAPYVDNIHLLQVGVRVKATYSF
jgi:hypothetical protein